MTKNLTKITKAAEKEYSYDYEGWPTYNFQVSIFNDFRKAYIKGATDWNQDELIEAQAEYIDYLTKEVDRLTVDRFQVPEDIMAEGIRLRLNIHRLADKGTKYEKGDR